MTMLFMLVGFLLAGQTGMFFAFLLAAAMNVFSWWNSVNMVLRMHNARQVETINGVVYILYKKTNQHEGH